jgi:hypothetical protein
MTVAARAIAAMKVLMLRSKRVAMRRQSLRRRIHIHGIHVPVEEPSTASEADVRWACQFTNCGSGNFHLPLKISGRGR